MGPMHDQAGSDWNLEWTGIPTRSWGGHAHDSDDSLFFYSCTKSLRLHLLEGTKTVGSPFLEWLLLLTSVIEVTLRPKHASIRSLIAGCCTAGKDMRRQPFQEMKLLETGKHDLLFVHLLFKGDRKFEYVWSGGVPTGAAALWSLHFTDTLSYVGRVKSSKALDRNEVSLLASSKYAHSIFEEIS